MNTEESSLLSLPQGVNQARRLSAETSIVCREPTRDRMIELDIKLCGYESFPGVHKREHAAEPVIVSVEYTVNQIDDPGPIKDVDPAGAAELVRFPAHERGQSGRIARVHDEPDLTGLALELAGLAVQFPAEFRRLRPELLLVRREPVGQVDRR